MIFVKDIMSSPAITISEDNTVTEAAVIMKKHNVGCLIVQSKTQDVIGIVTERDILFRIIAQGKDPVSTKIKEIMNAKITSVRPDMSLYEASTLLEEKKIRRLPVTSFIPAIHKDRLVGVVTETDIHIALRDHTIDELKTKVHELELFNKMAIGRELKMAELKKKIKQMEGKI